VTERRPARSISVLAWPAFAVRARNPYTASLYRHLEALGVAVRDLTLRSAIGRRPDLLHVQWPERAFASPRWYKAVVFSTAIVALLAGYRHVYSPAP
jgi:hypothetical protein